MKDIIYTKLNDGDKIHIGKELPTYDLKGKRVSAVNFRFDIDQIEITLSTGMGGLEQKKYLTISFEIAQEIGFLNLQVLNNLK